MGVVLCPVCLKQYSQLSQHLRVFHRVVNGDERRLLLALESGRIEYRMGRCPVLGCGKDTTRLDRHLKCHTELSKKAYQNAVDEVKKNKIKAHLAALRASNPKPPMATVLDLQEVEVKAEELEMPKDLLVQEELCCLESCRRKKLRLKCKIADLNEQIETLTATLCEITRRYRVLKRQSIRKALPLPPNPQHVSSLQSFDHPEPRSSPHLPDNVSAQNEQNGSPVPKVTLGKNTDGKITNCLVNMEEDNLNLPTVSHTSQGLVMLRPLNQLKLHSSHLPCVQVSTTKTSQARRHLVAKPRTLAGQVRANKARVKIEKALNMRRALLIK
ncbi:uncharacterized protein LOC130417257 [Triplophysa dalaica]|uniref:uncharacterized protein LOC130417257 n=1 Tax=Triplophysa dalaica TaxID=1582913 RepID=UPI0024DF3458|nr:uncharacterized protein LOC130417257 [Triplophysa dalaica]XP_056598627.1 uncharacterized protein LOC130417257 [Triplophysa dalaica]XP_056598628.1 uncharacterized protein LOC130417257 [Triplophysa dalaica]